MTRLIAVLGLLVLAVGAQGQFVFDVPSPWVFAVSPYRNCVYYSDEAVTFQTTDPAATSYEVRDYYGVLTASGPITNQTISCGLMPLGWYKLYLYGDVSQPPFGFVLGGETFAVVRHLGPARSDKGSFGGNDGDALMRAFCGKGPIRHAITDLSSVSAAVAQVQTDMDMDPSPNPTVAFPNGTSGSESIITGIVNILKYKVRVWEGRNEPEYQWGLSSGQYVKEFNAFSQAVHSADPTAKVIGPAVYSLTASWEQNFMNGFLKAAKGLDGISFHGYANDSHDASWPEDFTDAVTGQRAFSDLRAIMAANGKSNLPLYQTEQSYAAPLYGTYCPQFQGQRTMLHRLLLDQNGVSSDRDSLWRDFIGGFWEWPGCFEHENGSDSLEPAAVMYRVYSEEVAGCQFQSKLDFGPSGNQILVGNRYVGPTKDVLVIVGQGLATLSAPATVVSAFGIQTPMVTAITVNDVLYVEVPHGSAITPVPVDLGINYCRAKGVTAPTQLINGIDEVGSDYGGKTSQDAPWWTFSGTGPYNIDFTFPAPVSIGHCLIKGLPPAYGRGSLTSFDVQLWVNGAWQTAYSWEDPPVILNVFSPKNVAACTVDNFSNFKYNWLCGWTPITTTKARIVAKSWSGINSNTLDLREISFYK